MGLDRGTVSFDPNLRKEMLAVEGLNAAMVDILSMADLFFQVLRS